MVLVVLLTQKLILINNTGKIPSYQLSSGGRKLIAYQLAKGAGLINNGKANGASRANCSVPVLITLLLILVVIAAIQIAVVNYFGQLGPTIDNSGNTYGGPTFLHQWAMSPPPKINLHALLNRNVPSIESNLRRLKYQRNINAANRILSRENQQTLKKKTTRKPPNSPINDTDWISLNSIPDCPQVPSGLGTYLISLSVSSILRWNSLLLIRGTHHS